MTSTSDDDITSEAGLLARIEAIFASSANMNDLIQTAVAVRHRHEALWSRDVATRFGQLVQEMKSRGDGSSEPAEGGVTAAHGATAASIASQRYALGARYIGWTTEVLTLGPSQTLTMVWTFTLDVTAMLPPSAAEPTTTPVRARITYCLVSFEATDSVPDIHVAGLARNQGARGGGAR